MVKVAASVPLAVLRDWLPKERLVGERLTAAEAPVPERPSDWGLPGALSVILTEAVRPPEAVGVKVTVIVQLLLAPTEVPQLLLSPKSPVLLPVRVMLVMVKVALPVLVRVTLCEGLVVFKT